jgi:hypothetical protein
MVKALSLTSGKFFVKVASELCSDIQFSILLARFYVKKRAPLNFWAKKQDQCACMYYVTLIGMSLNKNCFSLFSNAEETSRRWTPKHRRYLQNVSANHHLLLVIFSFVFVNPLAATPLFPHISSLARAALFGLVVYMPRGRTVAPAPDSPKGPVRQCTIGTSPLSIRWWILEACIPSSPVTVSARNLSAMASPTLVMDHSDMARRVVESNLRVVWRGSQQVNLVYVYVNICKKWRNCGWRWDK